MSYRRNRRLRDQKKALRRQRRLITLWQAYVAAPGTPALDRSKWHQLASVTFNEHQAAKRGQR